MKKILFLFVLALLPTVAGATTNPTPEGNYLILHGDISINDKTTIMVFQYDTASCEWQRTEQQTIRKSYELLLDPMTAYQIWFQSPNGYSRIVYIDPGDPGIWNARLSINFDPESLAFIHMYQTCSEQNLGKYHAEYMHSKKQAEAELPANNCDYCNEEYFSSSN